MSASHRTSAAAQDVRSIQIVTASWHGRTSIRLNDVRSNTGRGTPPVSQKKHVTVIMIVVTLLSHLSLCFPGWFNP